MCWVGFMSASTASWGGKEMLRRIRKAVHGGWHRDTWCSASNKKNAWLFRQCFFQEAFLLALTLVCSCKYDCCYFDTYRRVMLLSPFSLQPAVRPESLNPILIIHQTLVARSQHLLDSAIRLRRGGRWEDGAAVKTLLSFSDFLTVRVSLLWGWDDEWPKGKHAMAKNILCRCNIDLQPINWY